MTHEQKITNAIRFQLLDTVEMVKPRFIKSFFYLILLKVPSTFKIPY